MTPLAAFALAGCLAANPDSDRIVAADLAPAFPALEILAPDTEIALAPSPGVTRVFRLVELRRLASRFNLPEPENEICIQRTVAPLDRAAALASMQKEMPEARIEILEWSRQPVPAGEIEFSARGLRNTPAGALWSGAVRYGGGRKFPVWARVKVVVATRRVVATADLGGGQAIPAGKIQAETREEFPGPGGFAESIDQVDGRWLRVPVRAGTAIRLDQLLPAKEVLRGDTVHVEVRCGAARLELEARAEADGALGDTIPVWNPESKKRFHARVEAKGRVTVDGPAGRGNL